MSRNDNNEPQSEETFLFHVAICVNEQCYCTNDQISSCKTVLRGRFENVGFSNDNHAKNHMWNKRVMAEK